MAKSIHQQPPPPEKQDPHPEDGDDSSSSDDDDDDLGLEGVLVRNPDVSNSSSSSTSDDENYSNDEEVGNDPKDAQEATNDLKKSDKKRPATTAAATTAAAATTKPKNNKKQRTKKSRRTKSPDMIQVDFTFHDMDDKFFHGLKALLHNSSTVYQQHSSELSNLMIDNVSVGTVVSTAYKTNTTSTSDTTTTTTTTTGNGDDDDDDDDPNVFGFASVLNWKTYQDSSAMQYLKAICLQHCPKEHRSELELVLSGTTKRPAGLLLHGRMINLPLEITLALHQQLVLDIDWAIEHAEGGIDERKSLDFGAFVVIAPCQLESDGTSSSIVHRYFDDEIWASRSEFSFVIDAPKSYSKEEPQKLQIMVLTKTGHRQALNDLEQMVGGG